MEADPEKAIYEKDVEAHGGHSDVLDEDVYEQEFDLNTKWGKFMSWNRRVERMLGIEARGIQRVPEDERHQTRLASNTDVWLAANTVLPTFGIGVLGPDLFELGLGDSMLTIFFFNAATVILPALCATFGPKLGLRQMTSARFSWGWHGAKIVAALNCIACVGWATINSIAGGQTLSAVADGNLTDAVGIVIIGLCTLVLGFFGHKIVHAYERWSWIPTAITFIILLGVSAKNLVNVPMGVGQGEAASVLSFGGVIFGFAAGWCSLASDYNVYVPAEAPAWKVFGWTYLGMFVPLVLVQWLGAAIMDAAGSIDSWSEGYADNELGGLLGAVLIPAVGNFGKFLMVLLVLSVVANNIINVYSMGLSISVISRWLAIVPRWIWPIFITAIYIPLGIVGAHSFSTTLNDFMSILGYWLAIFVTVLLIEHFLFRKGDWSRYNAAEAWNDKSKLPIGFAAFGAFLAGVAGAVVGMAEVWYVGPLAALAGGPDDPFGADLGFELASAFAGIMYIPLRYLELKYVGR